MIREHTFFLQLKAKVIKHFPTNNFLHFQLFLKNILVISEQNLKNNFKYT